MRKERRQGQCNVEGELLGMPVQEPRVTTISDAIDPDVWITFATSGESRGHVLVTSENVELVHSRIKWRTSCPC